MQTYYYHQLNSLLASKAKLILYKKEIQKTYLIKFTKILEEVSIVTIVEGEQVVLHIRQRMQHFQNFRTLDDL